MQNVTFGSLTSKSIHQINFNEFDLNKDGIITQEELDTVLEKNEFDLLDISSIDKNADQKVTKEEYELWQQESEMNELFEKMKEQAAHDMIGQSPEDIKNFISKLNDFKTKFEQNYLKNNTDISGMAKAFKEQLPIKYAELRKDAFLNNKEAVKTRVIENVIQQVIEESKQGGRTFLGLIENGANSLSDNAKRILSNELGKEADKFIKKYSGDDLEKDLTEHLVQFLAKSDKEKMSEAISIWEKSKENITNLSSDIAFKQLKDSAKNFLLLALEQGLTVTLGDIKVRTEVAITPAIAQFKDIESLRDAIDNIIKELSDKSKLDEIKEQEQNSAPSFFELNTDEINIFK